MRNSSVDKDTMAAEMQPLRDLFTKSIVVDVDLREGTVLEAEFLTLKKPGTGMPAEKLPATIGRRVARAAADRNRARLCPDPGQRNRLSFCHRNTTDHA